MSQEVLQIIQKLNAPQLELQLVMQCAPTIAGEKISNLFIIPNQNEKMLEQFMKGTDFCYYRLLRTAEKTTYLIFQREQLEEYLKDEVVQNFFEEQGYTNRNLGAVMVRFQARYQEYMKVPDKFPHEMGLILGYPVEDVTGFIEKKGRDFLYSGYWKVYADKEKKIELFQKYEEALNEQIYMLSSGMDIDEIITYYKTKTILKAAS